MFQDYFILDGKKYYTGTIFIVKDNFEESEATFVCYDTERQMYVYKLEHVMCHVYQERFYNCIVRVTNNVDNNVHFPETKTLPDKCINGLLLGWLWYIFLMVIATIFKGNVILWIIISCVFFDWRKKKVEKEGHYIEW